MSDDIREADAVVCVDARTPFANPRFPKPSKILTEGRVYRARDVRRTTMYVEGVTWAVEMFRFRKIDPAAEEFSELMRAMRPAQIEEPV